MDVIEFLQRTDQRNLKFNIDHLVKQKLRERDDELEQRRQKLRIILEAESMQYDEELLVLLNERLKASEQKRLDWIGLMRLERERAEQELLKVKNMQRELENCENWRHLETKKILIDTKKCQLYQIGEKRARERKGAQIDQMWQLAMDRLNAEKKRQDEYEQKLQKVIAGSNQACNTLQEENMKSGRKDESQTLRDDHAQENARATSVHKLYSQAAMKEELRKKLHHKFELEQQIKQNEYKFKSNKSIELQKETYNRMQEDAQIVRELNDKIGQRIRNREWHKSYLGHTMQERQQQKDDLKALDDAFVGTGCVLQQQRKVPYGKFVR